MFLQECDLITVLIKVRDDEVVPSHMAKPVAVRHASQDAAQLSQNANNPIKEKIIPFFSLGKAEEAVTKRQADATLVAEEADTGAAGYHGESQSKIGKHLDAGTYIQGLYLEKESLDQQNLKELVVENVAEEAVPKQQATLEDQMQQKSPQSDNAEESDKKPGAL